MNAYPETDERLQKPAVDAMLLTKSEYSEAYSLGMLCMRHDPGIRASMVFFNEKTQQPDTYIFDYEGLIAIAWLVFAGWPRRHAAAAVYYENVVCFEEGANVTKLGRDDFNYKLWDKVTLGTTTFLIVADLEAVPEHCAFRFVQDFGVVAFDAQGSRVDLEDHPFPEGMFTCERATRDVFPFSVKGAAE